MKPQAIHRQLDFCDMCGRKIHKRDLVYTNVRYNRPEGSNYFTYSRYDDTLWGLANLTATGSYDGYGPQGLGNRVRVPSAASYGSYETTEEIGGAPTFTITSPGKLYTKSGVDCSDWSTLCFGVYVGPYHANAVGTDPTDAAEHIELTVAIGVGATAGATTQTLRTVSGVRSGRHIYASVAVGDLDGTISPDDVYFWITVTLASVPVGTFKVWCDWMQLEKDATKPGAYINTSGSAEEYTTEQKLMTVIKVCPEHRERLLLESEQYGRPRKEVEYPIPSDIQEV